MCKPEPAHWFARDVVGRGGGTPTSETPSSFFAEPGGHLRWLSHKTQAAEKLDGQRAGMDSGHASKHRGLIWFA
jgi:hypothetical protein